ncbi:MAG: hypothetical protein ABI721_01620 [Candidatus Dojkabacteria bacterium]
MKKNTQYLPIYLLITVVAVFAVVLLFLNLYKGQPFTLIGYTFGIKSELPLEMDILSKLKMNYSDAWSIANNGTEGVILEKGDLNILVATAQTDGTKNLDDIVNDRAEKLKATKKLLNDTKVNINTIEFRRLEFGSLDETVFPSDGLISYSALVDKNIYLTLTLNFPPGTSPNDAESLVKTIRYN